MNQDIYVLIEHVAHQIADISSVTLAAGRQICQATGGELVAVLLGHEVEDLGTHLSADRIMYVDHPALSEFTPDAYQKVLTHLITDHQPRLVLFGDTSIGADIAAGLSVRLGLPIVSYCRLLNVENGDIKFVNQICGGKIMAEGILPSPTALVTMIPGGYKADQDSLTGLAQLDRITPPTLEGLHIEFKRYLEPEIEDVDISKEPILIAVGRGIQNENNIELAQNLVHALGGALAASRPVVDQDWLPITRLVGKSGKRVKPKIYLALGISGAPEHVESITDSEMIIAVNTDPLAPIFDIAHYGVEMDLFDLLPSLTEKIEEAKCSLVA